jgi:RNA polymerase sigma-70 factor (ECF subfamily)
VAETQREQRFRALYETSRARLVAYALRRVSPEDAADVVAETFAIAWRRLEDVPTGDAGPIWLFATARNVIANHRRKRARLTDLVGRIASDLRGSFALSTPPQDEDSLMATAALNELAESDQEVLMLVAWEGLSGAEVAAVLGCSPNAARIRVHWARVRLAEKLDITASNPKHRPSARHSQDEAPVMTGDVDEGVT